MSFIKNTSKTTSRGHLSQNKVAQNVEVSIDNIYLFIFFFCTIEVIMAANYFRRLIANVVLVFTMEILLKVRRKTFATSYGSFCPHTDSYIVLSWQIVTAWKVYSFSELAS